MAQKRALPRICIALGLPDLAKLLEHARREAEAGETFLEFRLDYLERSRARGRCHPRFSRPVSRVHRFWPRAAAIRTTESSTAASRNRSGCLDVAVRDGAQAVDIEIESAEAGPGAARARFAARAMVIISYHNFEATPQRGHGR